MFWYEFGRKMIKFGEEMKKIVETDLVRKCF